MAYAENTTVKVEKSISEIIALLKKAGADNVGQMEARGGMTVAFTLQERQLRFVVRYPSIDDMPTHSGSRAKLTDAMREEKRQQRIRQRARALLLVIKAKLESVESGVETFEQAFLANVVTANGQTVYERINDTIALEYSSGAVHPLLPAPGA
jgi:hypothetical protein